MLCCEDPRRMRLGVEDVLGEVHVVVRVLYEVEVLERLCQEERFHSVFRRRPGIVHVRVGPVRHRQFTMLFKRL